MIEKNYQPADIESRMSAIWEESGAFKAALLPDGGHAAFDIGGLVVFLDHGTAIGDGGGRA